MKIETKIRCGLSVLTSLVAIVFAGIASAQTVQNSQPDRTVVPLAEPGFEGTISETYKGSTAAWPKLPAPPAGAPNVVVIILDDVDFGQTSAFGGPIPTPELAKLAT